MSARIPHMLTRLMSESELDALNKEMQALAVKSSNDDVFRTWMDAAILVEKHRNASFERRANQTPSARRKSLSYRAQPNNEEFFCSECSYSGPTVENVLIHKTTAH